MQFAAMQEIVSGNIDRWGDDVAFISVNKAGYEDGVADIEANYPEAVLPILQDDSTTQAFFNCGAAKYHFYVLDGQQNVVHAHYALTIEDGGTEMQRLIDEVDGVLSR